MRTPSIRALLAAIVVALAVAGCQDEKGELKGFEQKPKAPSEALASDIYAIYKFFPQDMWRKKDATDGNPDGFNVTIYLVSGETKKGAFGDGIIKVTMDIVADGPDGLKEYMPVQTWEFSPEEAKPFRTTRPAIGGWAYQLYLFWDPDVDVLNKEIRISISYVRTDGKEILSRPTHRRVPVFDAEAYRRGGSGDARSTAAGS